MVQVPGVSVVEWISGCMHDAAAQQINVCAAVPGAFDEL
jgi:hypothetical protein